MGELNLERSKVKFDLWERKLLDLSTRNALLNLRIKGTSIPLFVPECDKIEDLLAQDKSFSIISRGDEEEDEAEESASETPSETEVPDSIKPVDEIEAEKTPVEELAAEAETESEKTEEATEKNPEEKPAEDKPVQEANAEAEKGAAAQAPAKKKIKKIPAKDYSIEDLPKIDEFKEYIVSKYEKNVLVSSLTNAVLDKNIKTLYRGAKTSMEENGANTLFLACGFLKWFEKDRKEPCYAPILLIPVELVKKFGIKYTMRRRDEDTQFNVTVSEKLRQDFKIEFDEFSNSLPTDEAGVDVKKVFEQVAEIIKPLKGW